MNESVCGHSDYLSRNHAHLSVANAGATWQKPWQRFTNGGQGYVNGSPMMSPVKAGKEAWPWWLAKGARCLAMVVKIETEPAA